MWQGRSASEGGHSFHSSCIIVTSDLYVELPAFGQHRPVAAPPSGGSKVGPARWQGSVMASTAKGTAMLWAAEGRLVREGCWL